MLARLYTNSRCGLQADVLLHLDLVEEPATTANRDARGRGLVAVISVLKQMVEVQKPARDAKSLQRRASAQAKLREQLVVVVEHLDNEIEVRT